MSRSSPFELPALPGSIREWKQLMASIDIRPSKGKGQNFLFDRNVVQRIVRTAEIERGDSVIEIGPGLGILTWELLAAGAHVTSIELDWRLAQHLGSFFMDVPAFRLVEGDALRVPFEDVLPNSDYQVVANLPYSVGTAVIQRFLEAEHAPATMTVMVQKEVAERLSAKPPDMSVLAVATQFLSTPKIAFTVSPGVFIPPPNVDSAVVQLVGRETELPRSVWPRFFRIVQAGFHQRRKNLANSLSHALAAPKPDVEHWLRATGIDPIRRAETLRINEWVALTESGAELCEP
jgi:16S rRNA (adenine1518-N6/adenine1519-N6)-dimethyltransferase